MERRVLLVSVLSLLVFLALAACGDSATPEAELEAAGEALEEAREDASGARDTLSEARKRLVAAESELRDARKELRSAKKRVLSAEARLELRATDVALFRGIQTRLLETDSLRQDAVTVRVDGGRVTLEGTVASESARETALQIARATPGVESVRDRLDVEPEDAS